MRVVTSISSLLILGMSLGTAFGEDRYDNPVDHRSYVTDGEFKTYTSGKPRDTTGQRVVTNGIRLLTGDADLKQRVRVEDMASFIKSAEAKAYPILGKNKTPALVLVQFNCEPNRYEVKIASQGDPQKPILQELYDAMKSLPPLRPRVKSYSRSRSMSSTDGPAMWASCVALLISGLNDRFQEVVTAAMGTQQSFA